MFSVCFNANVVLFVTIFLFGTDLWMNFGTAVDIVNEDSDYRWSAWSQFGLCTRSCGIGVKRRHRTCYRSGSVPVPVDAVFCSGNYEEYQTCNLQVCPGGSADFRGMQCSYFDGITHKGRKHNWLPFGTGHLSPRTRKFIDPCALICSSKGMSQFLVKFSSKVVDGTRCPSDPRSICVQGSCEALSCDLQLDSNKTLDACGVCGGDGRSCQSTAGFLHRNISTGYHDLLNIPQGATNIQIKELANSMAVLGE